MASISRARAPKTPELQKLDAQLFEVARQARSIIRANPDAPSLHRTIEHIVAQWGSAAGDGDEPALYTLNIQHAAVLLALNALHGIPRATRAPYAKE